jgi:predicted dehydrogenase
MKVCLVGCGEMAEVHLKCLKRIKQVQIAAVCDSNIDKAKTLSRKFRCNYYADFNQMLGKEKPQVCHITTPPKTHSMLAVQALKSGSHVFLEKPMTVSVKEADDIIEATKETGLKVSINHNRIFLPAVKKAKAIIDSGGIGELTGIEVKFLFYVPHLTDNEKHWNHSLPGGIFGEILPHSIYLTRFFLGETRVVGSKYINIRHKEFLKGDELRVIMESEKGLGTIINSFNPSKIIETIEVYGSRGNLRLRLPGVCIKWGFGKTSRISYFYQYYINDTIQYVNSLFQRAFSDFLFVFNKHDYYGTLSTINNFYRAIEKDIEPFVTPEDGKQVESTIEEIFIKSVMRINNNLKQA